MTYYLYKIRETVAPHELDIESFILFKTDGSMDIHEILDRCILRHDKKLGSAPWRTEQPLRSRFKSSPATNRMLSFSGIDYTELSKETFDVLSTIHTAIEVKVDSESYDVLQA